MKSEEQHKLTMAPTSITSFVLIISTTVFLTTGFLSATINAANYGPTSAASVVRSRQTIRGNHPHLKSGQQRMRRDLQRITSYLSSECQNKLHEMHREEAALYDAYIKQRISYSAMVSSLVYPLGDDRCVGGSIHTNRRYGMQITDLHCDLTKARGDDGNFHNITIDGSLEYQTICREMGHSIAVEDLSPMSCGMTPIKSSSSAESASSSTTVIPGIFFVQYPPYYVCYPSLDHGAASLCTKEEVQEQTNFNIQARANTYNGISILSDADRSNRAYIDQCTVNGNDTPLHDTSFQPPMYSIPAESPSFSQPTSTPTNDTSILFKVILAGFGISLVMASVILNLYKYGRLTPPIAQMRAATATTGLTPPIAQMRAATATATNTSRSSSKPDLNLNIVRLMSFIEATGVQMVRIYF